MKMFEIRLFALYTKIKNFGLIDALLVAKQKEIKCRIVSGDLHFKNLKQVVYMGT